MADPVEGARQRFIDEARKTALAVPGPRTAAESAEIAWERRNPAGYVEVAQDHTRVTLWRTWQSPSPGQPAGQAARPPT
jgi:hypothetical protein